MPSKHSERLKQAIEYIRSGEKQIAREMILEIIQDDPDYEKAWIWLVETVPDRANKIDILKTRLEQYPETSPYSRIALDKIAPEVLDTLVPPSEAIIYPPGMEPRSEATEDEIRYNVTVDEDDQDQFRLGEEELIQFEEPEDSSPFEASDSSVLRDEDMLQADDEDLFQFDDESAAAPEDDLFHLEGDSFSGDENELFAESSPQASDNMDFVIFGESEETLEEELDLFGDSELDTFITDDQPQEEDIDYQSWLDDSEPSDSHAENVDELADLLDDVIEDDEEIPIQDHTIDGFGVYGIQVEEDENDDSASNPFILDEDSKHILGSDVVEQAKIESQPLDELFRNASTGDLTPSTGFLDSPDFPAFTPDDSSPAYEISEEDVTTASEQFRNSLMAESISKSGQRKERLQQQKEKRQEKAQKKKKKKNATFIFGCSIMAAVLFFSLIAMGYVLLRSANSPVYKAVTVTPSPTSTITPTATAPLVAPWLDDEEDQTGEETSSGDLTQTGNESASGAGFEMYDLQGWIELYELYQYDCLPLEDTGGFLMQTCEYLDEEYNILARMYGTEEIMPSRAEFQVSSLLSEVDLPDTPALVSLLEDILAPVVIEPVAGEYKEEARDWVTKEAYNLAVADRDAEISETFGEVTITIEYLDYFLHIEL
ncbi:MAG: hypothetical protein V2J07_05065 [Anaerolineae bacterium]|jgi:hypothetical protein|nr:hypothetical protein [Anaerolineae bacterium]